MSDEEKQLIPGEVPHERCKKCKTFRTLEQFLNAKGRRMITCAVCRRRGVETHERRKQAEKKMVDNIHEKLIDWIQEHNGGFGRNYILSEDRDIVIASIDNFFNNLSL